MNNNTPASFQLKIAKDPHSPSGQLEELATQTVDKEVKARIAGNPNTPPATLVELSREYLNEIGKNPALELILMENPNFVKDIYYKHFTFDYTKAEDYSDYFFPDWFLTRAIATDDRDLKTLVISNKHTPPRIISQLARDPDPAIRCILVFSSPKLPSFILDLLIEDPNPFVRSDVIKHKKFSIFKVIRYILDRDERVRESVLERLDLNYPGSLYTLLVSVIAILLAGFKCLQIFFFSQ